MYQAHKKHRFVSAVRFTACSLAVIAVFRRWRVEIKEDWHLPALPGLLLHHALVLRMALVAELALIGAKLRYVVVIVGF